MLALDSVVQMEPLARRGLARGSWLVLALAGALAMSPAPASAQSRDTEDTEYGKGLEPFEADGPLMAVVSLKSQKINVWDRNGLVASSPISTGRKGYETPEGVFSIIERKVEHTSNLYDDASMPFMQRITWTGVALHAGVVPGYRASHGCIRLPEDFAERLFRTTRIATRVAIVAHDMSPLPIVHPALLDKSRPSTRTAVRPPSADGIGQPMRLGVEAPGTADAIAAASVAGPEEALRELRRQRAEADARLAKAAAAVNAAKGAVRPRLIEQGRTEKGLRQAMALTRRAEGRTEAVEKSLAKARSPAQTASLVTDHLDALIALTEARGREHDARAKAAEAAAAALSVQDQVKTLESQRQSVHNEVRKLARKMSPPTIFVSRATGRVYVRQAFHPAVEAGAIIRDPARPLGTHLFTALAAGSRADGLQWNALTIETPGGGSPLPAEPEQPGKRRKGEKQPPPVRPPIDPLATAKAALDRIEFPPEVLARVLPVLQPGTTLIISDLGPSIETGPGTDIVVQTRGEEQAKESIARFLAKKKQEELALQQPPSRRREAGSPARAGDWNRW